MRFAILWIIVAIIAISVSTANEGEKEKGGKATDSATTEKATEKKWDVAAVDGPHRTVEFTVDEGTWMNLDVSPDGSEIVFDLLGDIYTMPIDGGEAQLLSGGLPFEVHPRFSPDGKQILFTSDRGGGDNIWVMDRDGQNQRQITSEDFRLCNNAVWMADGQYIITKKHFTSHRSLGAGEMWMYHISGGQGIRLTERKNDQQDVGEPCVSPDGQFVYFSEDMSGGSTFEYNKDPNKQIYMIRRCSLVDGTIENVINGPGGAVRPTISPDGKLLAFVRRVRTKSVLFLHDLASGEEWPLYDGLSKDQQETWATFGVYPSYAWTPDGKSIVFWAKGKICKIATSSLQVQTIPFRATVRQTIVDALKFRQQVSPDFFTAKMIRHASTSPDGQWLVFNAVGHLWLKQLPQGKVKRLTTAEHLEFYPQFSPDGRQIVYTSWSDAEKGAVHVYDVATKTSQKLTPPGYYHTPSFSNDGSKIVYYKGSGNYILGFAHGKNTGIYWIDSRGGEPHFVCKQGENPQFNRNGTRIFLFHGGGEKRSLQSVDLNGQDARIHFTSQYATNIVVSPDNRWVAFNDLYKAYVAAFPQTGATMDLSANTKEVPLFCLTHDAGAYLHWSFDSKAVHWLLGPEYFTRTLQDSFAWMPGAPTEIAPPQQRGTPLGLQLKTDVPDDRLALVGARIVTMQGDLVIADGTIVVDKNRIVEIGARDKVAVPEDATVIDVTGKTIIPGIVDVHAHMGLSYNGISPQQQWSYYAALAYGVTTTHDPSAYTEMVFSQSEMVKAGVMVGPRIYSTGTILYGAEGDFKAVINSLDDARSHIRRMKAVGAFSVKSYNQPRRNQRQQVIKAARELEVMVYPEGGSFFYHNLSMVLDGHTGVEHCLPISPVYQDVIRLWGASKTGYTPTLVVAYGGIWGENYWYQKTEVWKKQRLLRYYPRPLIDSRSRRRILIPDDDFGHFGNARVCKALLDGGSNVQLGAHGQLHGLGSHWEMWMLAQGGFTPLEALRAATLMGAEYIGMDRDIGSLEKGKLADLVVLDKNPLEDIYNSEHVRYTMINGRLYDAETMHEIGNYDKKRDKFFWEYSKTSHAFPWFQETQSFTKDVCGCRGAH